MQKIKNIGFRHVTFDGGFWKQRYDLNREVSLQSVYARFEETGRFDALRFLYQEGKGAYPHIFFDSDVAKWIEAVGYLVEKNGGYEEEQAVIDALVSRMAEHQLENGYLNSHFIQVEPQNIFQRRADHELYCAGHLIEAAIAYDRATGKHAFLQIMLKYVDCIERAFVTERTAAFYTCGHEEIELALLWLYDYTGEARYLDLAMFFLDARGVRREAASADFVNNVQDQSDVPVRDLRSAEGHAVRAAYLYTAMSEAYLKTGDEELYRACLRLFEDIVEHKMYVTGGIGSGAKGEALTVPYDLPNLEAYSESCAALGMVLFALSLQQTARDHRFADVIERVMYNNMLSSTSLDGKGFFYENELEIHLADVGKETGVLESRRMHLPLRHRLEVFGCSCCPPNINRLFARVGDLFFSEEGDTLIVNQYADLTLDTERVRCKLSTAYPADGAVTFEFSKNEYKRILLRRPTWCRSFCVTGASYTEADGYIEIPSDAGRFTVDFRMHPYFVEANPNVRADNGRVALCYGPTVYCMERLDNPHPLNALTVDVKAEVRLCASQAYPMPDLSVAGYVDVPFSGLYRRFEGEERAVTLAFRPYWTFANREECDMLVWTRRH